MNIFVGWTGSCHNARILANSTVFAEGEAGDLVPDRKKRIAGVDVPIAILCIPFASLANETIHSHWPINSRAKVL